MKFIATCVMLAGLLGSVGCTTTDQEKAPSRRGMMQSKSAKPVEEGSVPAAVSKLLPAENIDQSNYQAQMKILADQLDREKGQFDKTESARRK